MKSEASNQVWSHPEYARHYASIERAEKRLAWLLRKIRIMAGQEEPTDAEKMRIALERESDRLIATTDPFQGKSSSMFALINAGVWPDNMGSVISHFTTERQVERFPFGPYTGLPLYETNERAKT